jgi:hypothetical protein
VSFLTPAEYHDLVLERLQADVIFSLHPLYKQLPLPVRTISREELDPMSTFSCARTYWVDQRTKHDRGRYSSEVQAARSRGKRRTDEQKRRLKEARDAFWEQYHVWKAEQGKGDWKRKHKDRLQDAFVDESRKKIRHLRYHTGADDGPYAFDCSRS